MSKVSCYLLIIYLHTNVISCPNHYQAVQARKFLHLRGVLRMICNKKGPDWGEYNFSSEAVAELSTYSHIGWGFCLLGVDSDLFRLTLGLP